jgi:2-C-methyl-D-erythritol 4-phosphate cytidylyltransferase
LRDRKLALVVVAAGSARRMEGLDKVWEPLAGQPVICHSLAALAPSADQAVLVVRADQVDRARTELQSIAPGLLVVPGGAERQDSVRCGLAAIGEVDVVAVHDAARPLAGAHLLEEALEELRGWDGAVPVQPLHDTVKRIDPDGRILETVDRSMLRAAQTPQAFLAAALREAHELAIRLGRSATDDASLLEQAGFRIRTFPGSPTNIKITTGFDLELARWFMERERRNAAPRRSD